jgi:ABC-type uncharacterized transport system permease subunit
VVGIALKMGLDSDWMKLATAVIFVLVIVLQRVITHRQKVSVIKKGGGSHA